MSNVCSELLNIFNPTRDRLVCKSAYLAQTYKQAAPYPHLVIDELFAPQILYYLLNEFLFRIDDRDTNWRITSDLRLESKTISRLSDFTRTFYFWLNSSYFVDVLTLIVDRQASTLVGDPTLYGASLCGILPGGKLESKGNLITHPHLPLVCEFNLIICLNNSLNHNYPGQIELYSHLNEDSKISYTPKFNRTLILPITDKIKYRIFTGEDTYESSKFFSIYYWSDIAEGINKRPQ